MSGLCIWSLREICLAFVLVYCPDIVLLQAMDNDLDSSGPIDQVVGVHVEFATQMSSQMGGIKVVICGPLHRRFPHFLSMEAYNDNVDQCNIILRERLMVPAFIKTKHLDMQALIVPNIYLWEHRKM